MTNDTRRKLDADILISVSAPRDSVHDTSHDFLIAAQTVKGASATARALRDSGHVVTVRVWNGRAYSEERI